MSKAKEIRYRIEVRDEVIEGECAAALAVFDERTVVTGRFTPGELLAMLTFQMVSVRGTLIENGIAPELVDMCLLLAAAKAAEDDCPEHERMRDFDEEDREREAVAELVRQMEA